MFVKEKINTLCSRTDLIILRGHKLHVGKFLCDIYILLAIGRGIAALPEHCSSKLKEFADNNFKFDKNGRKLSKRVENTLGKGEIALRAISPFPTVFSKGLFPRGVKRCHCVVTSLWCFL